MLRRERDACADTLGGNTFWEMWDRFLEAMKREAKLCENDTILPWGTVYSM
jgi:hypothetical protein